MASPLVRISHQEGSLGSWLISVTQHRCVFALLYTLYQNARKPSLLCGVMLEAREYDCIPLIPNNGCNFSSLQSLALLQSISNPTRLAKANPDPQVANWILNSLENSSPDIGGSSPVSVRAAARNAGSKKRRIKQTQHLSTHLWWAVEGSHMAQLQHIHGHNL